MKKILTVLLICALMLPLFALYPPGISVPAEEEVGENEVRPLGSANSYWNARRSEFNKIADDTVEQAVFEFFRAVFDPEAIVDWWVDLYDPEEGGFYYSISARDTEGFLPDMESTYQICQRLHDVSPINHDCDDQKDLRLLLGDTLADKILRFYTDKKDTVSGYYYHPQWTREVSNANLMRRSRDKNWAGTMIGWLTLSGSPSASTVDVTVRRLASNAKLTRFFDDHPWGEDTPAAMTAYVNNLLATETCESWANTLETQKDTLKSSGLLGTVLDILDARINTTWGLWTTGPVPEEENVYYNLKTTPQPESLYGMLTCTYKVAALYEKYNEGLNQESRRPLPSISEMEARAIEGVLLDEPGARITYCFNPWATLGKIWENVRDCHGQNSDEFKDYLGVIAEDIEDMLDTTLEILSHYQRDDGTYSYLQSGSEAVVNGTPVSLGWEEGDVNATNMVISLATHVCHAVGTSAIAIVDATEAASMVQRMAAKAPIEKVRKPDRTFENDFTDDPLNECPDYALVWPQDTTTFAVVEEPGNTSNKVLQIEKTDEDGRTAGLIELPLLAAPLVDDGSALEFSMRIYVDDGTRYGTGTSGSYSNLMQMRFTCGGQAFWMPTLRFNRSSNTPTGFDLVVGKNTSGGGTEFPAGQNNTQWLSFGAWHTFTFRLTVKNFLAQNAEFRAEIYVDGEYYGTSKCFFDSNYSGLYDGTVKLKHGEMIGVRFALQKRTHAKILIDDLKATYTRTDLYRNFSDDTLNARPEDTTTSTKPGTTFKVIEEPGNTLNKVLEIKKDTETNQNGGTLTVPLLEGPTMNNGTTLEFRMRLNVSSESRYGVNSTGGNRNLMQIRFRSGDDTLWMPTLQFNQGTQTPTGYYLGVGKHTSTYYANFEFPDNKDHLFDFDTWYEFTFRMTIKQFASNLVAFKVEIFVDGEKIGESECFYADDDYSSFDSGTINFENGEDVSVRFCPQARAHALIYVDDIKATYTHDDYFRDFSGDTIGQIPVGSTLSAATGTSFRVIEETANVGNRVLEISKNTEANDAGGHLTVPVGDIPKWNDTSILEVGMRINVSSASRYGNNATGTNTHRNLMQMRFMCNNVPFWMPTLRFKNGSNPTQGYNLTVGKNTSTSIFESPDGLNTTFAFDTWYEFKFRIIIKNAEETNAQFRVEIYVNGEKFGTSTCFYSLDDYSSLTSGSVEFRDEKELRIRFAPQSRAHALIYVDDLYANYTQGN